MKWLLVFVFIASCGKHESPGVQDLGDSDGDSISNSLEQNSEFSKYLADVKLSEIKGVMRINQQDFSFSNRQVTLREVEELMTREERSLLSDKDLLKIRLTENQDRKIELNPENELSLSFESNLSYQAEIYFVKASKRKKISLWTKSSTVKLSKNEIEDLLQDRAFLAIRKIDSKQTPDDEQLASVLKKTYKITFFDGEKVNVYYVSKELKLEDFMSMANVLSPMTVDTKDLIHDSEPSIYPQWWMRNLPNNELVISYNSAHNLASTYLSTFSKDSSLVQRVEGQATNVGRIHKAKNANILLKVRAHKTLRVFTETRSYAQFTRPSPGGLGDSFHCYLWTRNIAQNNTVTIEAQELYEQLEMTSDGQGLFFKASQHSDSQGPYWIIPLSAKASEVTLKLKNLPESTYTLTGGYQYEACRWTDKPLSPSRVNKESSFTLSYEALVENLE